MISISERLARIKPSATLAVNTKALELKAQGREVISLAVGEPDFPTPPHVIEAAKAALDQGKTRYTPVPGVPELREAFAKDYFGRIYRVQAKADNMLISNGGKHSLYNLIMALVNPGDEVLVPSPYWVSYPAMVELAGGVARFVAATEDSGFLISVQDLEAASSPLTRVLILNSPSNPTGRVYPQEQMTEIAEWARRRGVFIISDEVYDLMVNPPAKHATLTGFWEKYPESVAISGALSKTFCMPGLRVGYTLAHAELIKACSKLQSQSTSNVSTPAQWAALAAVQGPLDHVENMVKELAARRDTALESISRWPGVSCPKPEGAFYLFPVLEHYLSDEIPDTTVLCTKLLEEAGVAAVPGAAFGDPRCIRLSYAVSEQTLNKALKHIEQFLSKLPRKQHSKEASNGGRCA
ncbi:MAG: aspartate aminotransferase [Desulfovibrionales bacterium]|jgi:aspartate aminotransferase|nr:aspartate aminotransferase [Desulfovibrionales bacterium]